MYTTLQKHTQKNHIYSTPVYRYIHLDVLCQHGHTHTDLDTLMLQFSAHFEEIHQQLCL